MKFPLLPLFALVLAGCSATVTKEVVPVKHPLEKGTPVSLILAKQLNAGSSKEGEVVPLLVAEDVLAPDGSVIIAKGTPAKGEVSWSRSEGTLSSLMNRPARLVIRLQSIEGTTPVPLCANKDTGAPEYELTRENTGVPGGDRPDLDDLLKDEASRRIAEALNDAFEGKTVDLSTPDAKAALDQIATKMGLTETRKADLGQVSGTIDRLQHGDFSGLAKGDVSLTLGAVMELANLAGGLGSKISRSLKGRTICAYPGTKVEAYTSQAVTLPTAR